MKVLDFKKLKIPEVKILKFANFTDERGYFTEVYRESDFVNISIDFPSTFVQVNETYSKAGTFRGLHFQWNPYMGKLVRCIKGHLIDFALDIRLGSPTFGKIIAYEFRPERNSDFNAWIWVPPGFAHGTLLLEDSFVEYFCTGEYSPNYEAGITIYDKDIDWSFIEQEDVFNKIYWLQSIVYITKKDKNAFTLKQWKENLNSKEFEYEGE